MQIKPGITAETGFVVEEKHLATEMGSGMVSVFSTAMLVAGLEAAAVKAIQPYLEEGTTTVGVHVDVKHEAATPLGMKVNFRATLEEVAPNGKGFRFSLLAWDEKGQIGSGFHERVMINLSAFEQKTNAKAKS